MTPDMTSVPPLLSANATFIRPSAFYINGFYNIPHTNYYYVFLCTVFAVTVLGNSFIMCIIYLARTLHTAKYIAVFNLALSDLGGSSALIPKLIDTFLFENQVIAYEACLANMYFVLFFMTLQSLTLLVMGYDRVVAICFPLRYSVIVNKAAMTLIIIIVWIFSITIIALLISLITRLSFCRSIIIDSYFCDHGPTYILACNDKFINYVIAIVCFAVLVCVPVIFITVSYICIGIALMNMSHGFERKTALKTCTSHLILVGLFYVPHLATNISVLTSSLKPNVRIINSTLTQTIPPMLNPIIYTLKTKEVLHAVKVLYKRVKAVVIHGISSG
ncbi:putative gustatory receptor clone PTE01 [Neoarius graeffei]|uniref:putative gustatory receptor clone PTE01 n=1 Tax=Neoarius graeffei TaxID=443677 RepID=UPI00298D2C57|nr:putative gustatory receptor clone PTE01 [Neoarius graeffei]XP_060759553.1 putative gustatory receptor clone PTE01 [Neoarius graeffei]